MVCAAVHGRHNITPSLPRLTREARERSEEVLLKAMREVEGHGKRSRLIGVQCTVRLTTKSDDIEGRREVWKWIVEKNQAC